MRINFPPYVTSISKTIKSGCTRFFSRPQKDYFQPFKAIRYEKFTTLAEMQAFAGLNFPNTSIITNNISDGKRIIRTMCKLHNMTRGKILFPPEIKTFKKPKGKYSGDYGGNLVRLNSACKNLESTLAHEIAHYNHEQLCADYCKMGKESELIADGITDFSIFDEFNKNKTAKNLIKRYLGGYATSSPCEFVACTFESLANGRILPIEIWELYKKYGGPHADILKPLFAK